MRIYFLVVSALLFSIPAPVFAYLDPGTGSMIVQAIIGVVVGALVVLKVYWRRLLSLFSRRRPFDEDDRPHSK